MAKTNVTFTNFAAKKLLGKTQVRPSLTDAEEAYPSNVSVPGAGVFAETIPREPGTEFFTLYSASADSPATVERVYFDCVAISDGYYDADAASADGGDESQSAGNHAYYLKLPSNYQTTSSNPNRGTGSFVNNKRLYLSRGGLQLIPPFTTDAGLPGSSGNNNYFVELYKGDPTNPSNKLSETDAIDWQFDYYSGIIFIQDYDASKIPLTASAYLYVGKYLDEKITDLSSSIGSGGGDVSYGRTAVTTTMTASTSAKILGVSASAALDIRLPAASGYSAGQYFTIKDEGGNSNTNNITIKTTGADKIDGQSSVILESPYGAINVYSDGSSKFFIY